MSFENFMNYDSDGFCFTKTVGGFHRCVEFINPVELYSVYPNYKEFTKSIDSSIDYVRYLIWSEKEKTIAGFLIYNKDESCLESAYIKKEYRRLGLYKKSIAMAEKEYGECLQIQTDSKSKSHDYLTRCGYVVVDKFDKIMLDGSVRKEYIWKKNVSDWHLK